MDFNVDFNSLKERSFPAAHALRKWLEVQRLLKDLTSVFTNILDVPKLINNEQIYEALSESLEDLKKISARIKSTILPIGPVHLPPSLSSDKKFIEDLQRFQLEGYEQLETLHTLLNALSHDALLNDLLKKTNHMRNVKDVRYRVSSVADASIGQLTEIIHHLCSCCPVQELNSKK